MPRVATEVGQSKVVQVAARRMELLKSMRAGSQEEWERRAWSAYFLRIVVSIRWGGPPQMFPAMKKSVVRPSRLAYRDANLCNLTQPLRRHSNFPRCP